MTYRLSVLLLVARRHDLEKVLVHGGALLRHDLVVIVKRIDDARVLVSE